jgi:hypothetical protein
MCDHSECCASEGLPRQPTGSGKVQHASRLLSDAELEKVAKARAIEKYVDEKGPREHFQNKAQVKDALSMDMAKQFVKKQGDEKKAALLIAEVIAWAGKRTIVAMRKELTKELTTCLGESATEHIKGMIHGELNRRIKEIRKRRNKQSAYISRYYKAAREELLEERERLAAHGDTFGEIQQTWPAFGENSAPLCDDTPVVQDDAAGHGLLVLTCSKPLFINEEDALVNWDGCGRSLTCDLCESDMHCDDNELETPIAKQRKPTGFYIPMEMPQLPHIDVTYTTAAM